MTRNQRLGFLGIAALIAVVAVVLLAGGGEDSGDSGEQASQTSTPTATATATGDDATPEATETATPTPTPRPKPPLLQAGSERELEFKEGQTIRFRVRSDVPEEVHVHGYDRYIDVPAGKTVTASFKASITGIFEIELHGSGEPIGQLKVEP